MKSKKDEYMIAQKVVKILKPLSERHPYDIKKGSLTYSQLSKRLKIPKNKLRAICLEYLLEEGICYEPTPDRIKYT